MRLCSEDIGPAYRPTSQPRTTAQNVRVRLLCGVVTVFLLASMLSEDPCFSASTCTVRIRSLNPCHGITKTSPCPYQHFTMPSCNAHILPPLVYETSCDVWSRCPMAILRYLIFGTDHHSFLHCFPSGSSLQGNVLSDSVWLFSY